MSHTDQHLLIQSQIQHLRKVRKEIDLSIQSLQSLLPDRDPTERQPAYVLNPKTGKKEKI